MTLMFAGEREPRCPVPERPRGDHRRAGEQHSQLAARQERAQLVPPLHPLPQGELRSPIAEILANILGPRAGGPREEILSTVPMGDWVLLGSGESNKG